MLRRQASCATSVLAVLAALLGLALGAPGADAHEHPTQVELDAPAVVEVRTFAEVDISLIEHNRAGRHIGLVQRTYEVELSKGSGFAVDPNGIVVTAGGLVTPDLERAKVWAVNKVFNERYHGAAPMPRDPFTRQRIKDRAGDPVNARLQRCYRPNTTDDTGGCLVTTNRLVRVFPWVSSQGRYGRLTADVLSPGPGRVQDVAVLRVGASSMPTVALSQSAAGTKAFTVLGFEAEPTSEVKSELQLIGHFKDPGGGPLDSDKNLPPLLQGLRAGVRGGPLVAAQSGQVAGFLTVADQAEAAPAFVDAKRVRQVLDSVGVEPHRGPTDAVFEDAMHSFKNKLYTAPIPSFQRALELYPGHALAARYLAESRQKQGTAEDLTGRPGAPGSATEGGGLARWLLAVPAALLLGAVPVAVVLLRRRAAREAEAEAAPEPPERPPSGLPAALAASRAGQRRPREDGAASHGDRPAGSRVPPGRAVTPTGPPVAGQRPTPPEQPGTPPGRRATPPGPPPVPGQRATPPNPPVAPGPPLAPVPVKSGVRPRRQWSPSAPVVVGGREAKAAAAAVPPAASPPAGAVPAGGPAPGEGAGAPAAARVPADQADGPPQRSFCTQCGGRLGSGNRFCGNCGSPVG
ncbi:MAG TPA: zinc ribbon domain-containing protein [Actinomycetes bacterium]|nr:zinc ribbon domain-containing protein [Actinomycetes bacterium]